MSTRQSIGDWFDARTGYRAALHHLIDEPIPSGVNWWFTLGSVLLFLIVLQIVTGAVLTMYYVPTPVYAHDSVQFIMTTLTFGRLLRGLHFFGASFIVIAAGLHLLRVLFWGAYKSPREVTWWTGVLLLLVIMALALTGYLLPWDNRAYWATVVTINIVRSMPVVGDTVAGLLRGGPAIGALTLSRWYAVHIIMLPAVLCALVAAHLYLMRRHGTAGHFRQHRGMPRPFYPAHAIKETLVAAAVFAALFSLAAFGRVPLGPVADRSDAMYVPRPEWYFLGFFQLLKYFPGKLEPIAAHLIPGLAILLLFLLPLVDRGRERDPRRRRAVSITTTVLVIAGLTLTGLGLYDAPKSTSKSTWTLRAIAGLELASSDTCTRCHTPGRPGPDLTRGKVSRDDLWISGHVADPEMIAPGLRPAPPTGLTFLETSAVIAYIHEVRAGAAVPALSREDRLASAVFATGCISCHSIDGEGGKQAPDLTHAASIPGHDAAWFERWIKNPSAIDPAAEMSAFNANLSDAEVKAISGFLARRH